MPMMPKRVKYRKSQRGVVRGNAQRGNFVAYGDFGLQSLDGGWLSAESIEAGRIRIVVDLTDTTFLDSTALGVLIGAVKRLRSRHGALAMVNVDENISKTFEITGLDQIFTIVATRDEAVDAVAPAHDNAG